MIFGQINIEFEINKTAHNTFLYIRHNKKKMKFCIFHIKKKLDLRGVIQPKREDFLTLA